MPATRAERRTQFLRSFEAKSLRSRSFLTKFADDITAFCGSIPFLIFHVFFFAGWILANLGFIPGITPFDAYPFGFLTMCVSLEAIFLAIFILVSQNRSSYTDTIREEVHLAVNVIAEEEITKILEILAEMRQEMGITRKDPQLDRMLERIDTNYIEHSIASQLERANKPLFNALTKEFPELFTSVPINLARNFSTGVEREAHTVEKEIMREVKIVEKEVRNKQ